MLKPIAAAALLALSLPAMAAPEVSARDRQRADKLLAGRTAGEPASCIPRRTNDQIERIGESLFYSDTGRRKVWRNDPAGGCSGGGIDPIFVTVSPLNQVCRGDIVRLIDRTSRVEYGSCVLGDFTPYTRAK